MRAYIAENGGLTPARVDDFGISLPFLDAAARKVSRAAELLGDLVREEAGGSERFDGLASTARPPPSSEGTT